MCTIESNSGGDFLKSHSSVVTDEKALSFLKEGLWMEK